MSYSGSNAHELTARLLAALDSSYDVVDMHAVNEIISVLEKIHITKDLLETTRLGRHVNLLRRRTRDPSLARRAKVLVKRWRDLVIPGSVQQRSGGHGHASRSSAERHARPLSSPALSRVVSPAVPSPASSSRPGWSGYDSDSQDVILVDDDPPPPPPPPPSAAAPHPPERSPPPPPPPRSLSAPAPAPAPAVPSPAEARRAKRDKKPKKKRGHSRAGSESATAAAGVVAAEAAAAARWGACNGASPPPAPPAAASAAAAPAPPARRNGCRKPQLDALDAYSTLINKMPPAGSKKVKTTKELLEAIQSRGPALSPARHPARHPAQHPARHPSHHPPRHPAQHSAPSSPDVQLIESPEPPEEECNVASPLRNGGDSPLTAHHPPPASPPPPPSPQPEEEPYPECTCGEEGAGEEVCPAARGATLQPLHVHALHHAFVPGVNGTRAPPVPHPHAVRALTAPHAPELFASVVPLYRYLDYADDYCSKNLSRVDLCPWLRRDEFAPSPPPPPPPPSPPPPRPLPLPLAAVPSPLRDSALDSQPHSGDEEMEEVPERADALTRVEGFGGEDNDVSMKSEVQFEVSMDESKILDSEINDKPDSLGSNSPEERLRPPDEAQADVEAEAEADTHAPAGDVEEEPREHRPVERAKAEVEVDGRALYACCERARAAAVASYADAFAAPLVSLSVAAADDEAAAEAFAAAERTTERDALGRPARARRFAEWHEAARLAPDLVALPYVVID